MPTTFNFNAGPGMLPRDVMQQARDEFLNWHQTGASIMELSHRGDDFLPLAKESEKDLRDLLSVPENYHILFLPGGARIQFSTIPMNLLHDYHSVAYVLTGVWGQWASDEASQYTRVNIVANAASTGFTTIPAEKTWQPFSDAAYLHYIDNETVNGVEFPFVPSTNTVPLICDMSSNILSRVIDVKKFGLIYACAQKNISIAGMTIVIIRDDLLKRKPLPTTPKVLQYAVQAEHASMYNTPSTYPWYLASLVFKWLKKQGGITEIEKRNAEKAKRIYDYLDSQDFYITRVEKPYRSRMNIVFKLPSEVLDEEFAKEAAQHHLIGLKGHRFLGGIRASIYNAMPIEGVEQLIGFMKEFAIRHQR